MKTFVAVVTAILVAGVILVCAWEFVVSPSEDWQKRKHDALTLLRELDQEVDEAGAALNGESSLSAAMKGASPEQLSAQIEALQYRITIASKASAERQKALKALKKVLETKPFFPLNAEESNLLKQINQEFAHKEKEALPTSDELTSAVRESAAARDSNEFQDEHQMFYARITKPTRANTPSGSIDLQPGNLVLVTARNSQFARVRLEIGEATVPLSAIDLAQK